MTEQHKTKEEIPILDNVNIHSILQRQMLCCTYKLLVLRGCQLTRYHLFLVDNIDNVDSVFWESETISGSKQSNLANFTNGELPRGLRFGTTAMALRDDSSS